MTSFRTLTERTCESCGLHMAKGTEAVLSGAGGVKHADGCPKETADQYRARMLANEQGRLRARGF